MAFANLGIYIDSNTQIRLKQFPRIAINVSPPLATEYSGKDYLKMNSHFRRNYEEN